MRNPFGKGPTVKWPYRVEYRILGFWPCGTLVGPRYLKESLRPWVRPLIAARIAAMPSMKERS